MINFNYKEFEYNNALKECDPEDILLVSCPETEKELFYMTDEKIHVFESFGFCCNCEEAYHTSVLAHPPTPSEWPVQYEGKFCKECYYDEDVLTDEEIKFLKNLSDGDE